MSEEAAQEFVKRVEGDEKLAAELDALKGDPLAVLARVRAEGFEADPGEIRAAFLERHRAELSPEQLDTVAAGISETEIMFGVWGVGGTAALIAAAF
jgi:predicted ribosomally synthesized peptide with nif11-like leader